MLSENFSKKLKRITIYSYSRWLGLNILWNYLPKRDIVKIFLYEINSRPLHKNCLTDKTKIEANDDTWSKDILGLKYYGPENYGGVGQNLVLIDNIKKLRWLVPLKDEILPKLQLSVLKTFSKSIETDDGSEFVSKKFTDLQKKRKKKKVFVGTSP